MPPNRIFSKIQKALGLTPRNTVSPQKAEHSQASHISKKRRTEPTTRSPEEICLNLLALKNEIDSYCQQPTYLSKTDYFKTPEGRASRKTFLETLKEINEKLADTGQHVITTSQMLSADQSGLYFLPLTRAGDLDTPERMRVGKTNLRRIEDQFKTDDLAVLALLIVAALNIMHFETILSRIQTPGNLSTPTTQQEDTIIHDDLDDIRRKLDLLLVGQSTNHDILQENNQILRQNQEMLDTIQGALDKLTSNKAMRTNELRTKLSTEDKIEAIKQRLYIQALKNGRSFLSGSTSHATPPFINPDVARKCAIGLGGAVAGSAAAALVVTAGALFPPAAPAIAAACTYASRNALQKLKSVAHEHVEQRIKQKLNIVEKLTEGNKDNINTLHTITETETGQNIIWLFQLLLNKIANNRNPNNLLDFIEGCNTLSDLRVTLPEKISEIIGRDNQTYIVNAILSKILPAGIVDQANNTSNVLNEIKDVAKMINNISNPKAGSQQNKCEIVEPPAIPRRLRPLDLFSNDNPRGSPASATDLTEFQIST